MLTINRSARRSWYWSINNVVQCVNSVAPHYAATAWLKTQLKQC